MSGLKRNVKDSVFTALFGELEYALQLYRSLHPEDTAVSIADCKIVTLELILSFGLYNDLGLQVRDRLIVLVEAQSTFSPNIVLRLLLYLAKTYEDFVRKHKISLYSSKPVRIPRPELYVIYTGSRTDVPARLRLSDLYGGNGCVEVEAVILTDGDGILGEYVEFCKISDELRKKLGNSEETIREIIRVCKQRGVLKAFLESREKEVTDIMRVLFTQEEVDAVDHHNTLQEGIQIGRQQGMQKGIQKGAQNMGTLWKELSALDRVSEYAEAIENEEKLRALAEEFGLEL